MFRTILIAFWIVTWGARAGLGDDRSALHTITVSGKTTVRVIPNEAELVVGVRTFDAALAKSKDANDQRTQNAVQAAKSLGIDARDIQSSQIAVEIVYAESSSYGRNYEKIAGYVTNRTITLRLRDLSKFEQTLTTLLGAGVNEIARVELKSSELRKYKDEARAGAMHAALQKATAMAKELGLQVGAAVTIQEEAEPVWYANAASNANFSANAPSAGGEAEGAFSAGEIPIEARVTISFELIGGQTR